MDKLKRYRHGARNGTMTPDPDGPFVRYEDVAAALEAALEDAERYRWLRALDGACDAAACVNFNMGFDWYEHHGAELDAAIDQARGKGGQEVGVSTAR
jgi:hypothetical protein